jgi:hypothetical protein
MSEVIDWHGRTVSSYQRTDWTDVLRTNGYTDIDTHEVTWEQPMTRDLLAARVRSISYIAEMPEQAQQAHVDRVLALVADEPEEFPLPYTTSMWWASRPPS